MSAWRFRTNWRGKLILQVGRRSVSFYGMPYLDWSDATVEDITREGVSINVRENT